MLAKERKAALKRIVGKLIDLYNSVGPTNMPQDTEALYRGVADVLGALHKGVKVENGIVEIFDQLQKVKFPEDDVSLEAYEEFPGEFRHTNQNIIAIFYLLGTKEKSLQSAFSGKKISLFPPISDVEFWIFVETMCRLEMHLGKKSNFMLSTVQITEITRPDTESFQSMTGLHTTSGTKESCLKRMIWYKVAYEQQKFEKERNGKIVFSEQSFFQYLLSLYVSDDDFCVVPDFTNSIWQSFLQFVRSVLVCYFLQFGSFSSIGVCKNCNNLLISGKSGTKTKRFCSEKCRKNLHYFGSKYQNCINKQNNWIRRKRDSKYQRSVCEATLIKKENCKGCIQHPKNAGKCEILINLGENMTVIDGYNKGKSESQKKYKSRLSKQQ